MTNRFDIRRQYLDYLRLPDLDNNMEGAAILEAILFRNHTVFQELSARLPDDDPYRDELQHIAQLSLHAGELLATPFGEPIRDKLEKFAEVAHNSHAKVEVVEHKVREVLDEFRGHDALRTLDSAANPEAGLNEKTKHEWKEQLTKMADRINGSIPHPWEQALRVLIQRRINRLARELKPYSFLTDTDSINHLLASVRDMVAWEPFETITYDDRVEFAAHVYPLISLDYGHVNARFNHYPALYRLEVDLNKDATPDVPARFTVKRQHRVDVTVSVAPRLGGRRGSTEGQHDLWEPLDMPHERVVTLTIRQQSQPDTSQPNTTIENPFSFRYNGTPQSVNRLKRYISVKAVLMSPPWAPTIQALGALSGIAIVLDEEDAC